jgi:serine/threonine protein kinase
MRKRKAEVEIGQGTKIPRPSEKKCPYHQAWCDVSRMIGEEDFTCDSPILQEKIKHFLPSAPIKSFYNNYIVPETCLREDYEFGKLIGRGANSTVYEVCNGGNNECDQVVKIVELTKEMIPEFKRESEISVLMGLNGIGPMVDHWSICPSPGASASARTVISSKDNFRTFTCRPISLGFLVSKKMNLSLEDWIKKNFTRGDYKENLSMILAHLLPKITIMTRDHGYKNNDLHDKNVMLNIENEPFIIDYGRMTRISPDADADDAIREEMNLLVEEIKKTEADAARDLRGKVKLMMPKFS